MSRSGVSLCMLFVCILLVGCKKEEPNPEQLDPIYKDLRSRFESIQKEIVEENKKQVDIRRALSGAEPNSTVLRNARRDLQQSIVTIADLEQKERFYRIRTERRLLVDQITYKAALQKNLPWPEPREYSEYQVNTRLREASRNWNVRVPKTLGKAAAAAKASGKDKEKAEKKEE